jgi:hypothetical protein
VSNYSNMTVDFPSRVADILSAFEATSATHGREVTLLLALAGPSITLPLERLHKSHPSHDFQSLPQLEHLTAQFDNDPFLGSHLWPQQSPGSWCYGGPLASVDGDPDSWPELRSARPLDATPMSMAILRHIRNALSHGNVYTKGIPDIDHIVFLSWISQHDRRYKYLVASPADFRIFIDNWLSLLKPVRLPTLVLSEDSPAA